MPGGLPSGGDPSQLTPHPFSIIGAGLSALNTRTEPNVRAALEAEVQGDPDLTALSDKVFAGIDPALGVVAGVIQAILKQIMGAIPFVDLESPDAPAVQLLNQMDTFFTHWRQFLGDINFLDPDFDLAQAQQSFAQNVIQPFLDAVSGIIGSFISPGLLPLIPIGQLGDFNANLFLNGDFKEAISLEGSTLYTHDASEGRTALGSARTVANGTTRALFSNPILVAKNQKVDLSVYFKTTGVTSGANGIQLRVRQYNGETAAGDVLIDQATPSGTATWAQLDGQYTTPATGVTSIVVEIRVTTAVTSGVVHLDDATAYKTTANNLLPQEWISGLQGALNALTSLVDFNALKNILGAGASTLTAIGNRLNFLNPNGTFDASQLANMNNLPAIPDGIGKVADLSSLNDNVTNALSGLTALGQELSQTGLLAAKQTMANIFDMLSGVTRDLQQLQAEQESQLIGGRRFNINFADYPNGAFPVGLFNIDYSGAGTGVLAISEGRGVWSTGNGGYRKAFMQYPTPTDTLYQYARGTMGSPPEQGTNVRIWATVRMNSSKTDYVFARAWCNGFLSYRGEIGCVKGGVEYIWQTNVPLTWSLDMSIKAGVGTNPRRYQVFSGNTIVVDYTEVAGQPGGLSNMDENVHRYWGACSETNGGKVPGTVAGASITDAAPPAVVGTTFRASRRFGGDVTIGTGGVPVPNNFFETVDYKSLDVTYNPNDNCSLTVTKTGTYIVSIRCYHGVYAMGSGGMAVVFRNGVLHSRGPWADHDTDAGFQLPISQVDSTQATLILALQAGDVIKPGFAFSSSMANTGDNAILADGSRTYFAVTRVGV